MKFCPMLKPARDRAWSDGAACSGLPVEMFYPEVGATSIHSPAAKAICRDCPVARECLFDALTDDPGDDHGIRGATTKRERAKLRTRLAARRAAA